MSIDYELELQAQKLVLFIEQSLITLSETLDKAEEQNCSSITLDKCKRKLIEWTLAPNMSLLLQELNHASIRDFFGLSMFNLIKYHPIMSFLNALDGDVVSSDPCNVVDTEKDLNIIRENLRISIQKLILTTTSKDSLYDRIISLTNSIVINRGLFTEGLSLFELQFCRVLDQYMRSQLEMELLSEFNKRKWSSIKESTIKEISDFYANNNRKGLRCEKEVSQKKNSHLMRMSIYFMCLTNDSLSDIDVFNQKYSTLCNYEKKLINYLRDKDVKSQCQCIIEGFDSKFARKGSNGKKIIQTGEQTTQNVFTLSSQFSAKRRKTM